MMEEGQPEQWLSSPSVFSAVNSEEAEIWDIVQAGTGSKWLQQTISSMDFLFSLYLCWM